MDRRDALPALLVLLLGLLLHAIVAVLDGRALAGALPDTDSYARLIRVRELWAGAAWTDPVTPSFNAPLGLFLHWTRPLDVLILGPAWLLHHLAGMPRDTALFWSGSAICPLLHVATALAGVWAARAIWPRAASWLAGLLLLVTPVLFAYSALGRVDHHSLIALAGVLLLGCGLHGLRGRRLAAHGVCCGAAGGAGLWISPEAVLFLAPMLAGFGVAWLTGPDPRGAALQGLRASLAGAAVVALAILAERGPAGVGFVAYDIVSLPHLALCVAAAAVFGVAVAGAPLTLAGRLALGVAAGGAALGLLLAVFPGLPSASIADADPEAAELFLPHVSELQPLRFGSRAEWNTALVLLGGPAMASPVVLLAGLPLFRRLRRAALFAPLALAFAVSLWASALHLRFTVDLAVPAALIAAGLPAVLGHWLSRLQPLLLAGLRITLLLAVVMQPLLVGALLAAPEPAQQDAACDPLPLARWLAAERPGFPPGARPVLFADDMNAGPALAWAGGVRVVSGPYHRGGAAFADTRAVFDASDADTAYALLRRRQASLLLICQPDAVRAGRFRTRLIAGELPTWLEPVPLPDGVGAGARLFRVLPAAP